MEGSEWIWEGFIELGSCRNIGMALGPIPWTAIQMYMDVNSYDIDDREMFFYCIRCMDNVFLKEVKKNG